MTSDTILTILARISAANNGHSLYSESVAHEILEICKETGIDYDVLHDEQRRIKEDIRIKGIEQEEQEWKAAMESGDY